jgi:predicted nucleic acid-binding protein
VTWVVDASIALKWVIPEAGAAFDLVSESGIDLRPTGPLLPRAMDVARRLDHPVYDCVYLALAERERAALLARRRTGHRHGWPGSSARY